MKQGRLYKNTRGRYQLENSSYYWTSGDAMTIYDDELGWVEGRVEYGDTDYYWTNDEWSISLHDGLLVRLDD